MDNMLRMMEKYADSLEELVEEKTHQYMEEKKKADLLLYSMMPMFVLHIFVLISHKKKDHKRFHTPHWNNFRIMDVRFHLK